MKWAKPANKKHSKLATLRKFISGEDVVTDVLETSFDLNKLTTQQLTELARIKESDLSHAEKIERVKAMIENKGQPTWFENKVNEGEVPTWFDDTPKIDGKPVTIEQFEQAVIKAEIEGRFSWKETKMYDFESSEHSEDIAGSIPVPPFNEVTVLGVQPHLEKGAGIEPENRPTRQQLHRLELAAKMAEIEERRLEDLEVRNQIELWKKMNAPI